MPELPEVETVKRGMEAAILSKRVSFIHVERYDLRTPIPSDFCNILRGKSIMSLERRGKYIILTLEGACFVVLHLGMSGRIRIYTASESYNAEKHDHVRIDLEDGTTVVFHDPRRFGQIYTVTDRDWQETLPFAQMGAEPLGQWDARNLAASLCGKKTSIKTALLDQRIVAGLGNIYVCEALHAAGIHPGRMSGSLNAIETEKLVPCIQDVLERAIDAGGSTLRDYAHTDGSLGYFQYGFSVYDRENQPCTNCDCTGNVRRIVQAGRSTYFCPECQV